MGGETALDRYVAKPDPAYEYKLISQHEGDGCTTYILGMTSQKFLTEKDVNRTLWKHWMIVAKPHRLKHDTGLILITGGSNGGDPPTKGDGTMAQIAAKTGSVVTELKMVPNEPLQFVGEKRTRTEDSLIAYTWDKYLRTGDDRWPARLPMTKAVARAMDTVTDFLAKPEGGEVVVDKFVAAGGSKRGWTTWSIAAVDKRIVAIVPIVIDMLNVIPSFKHHYRAYGFYAPAVKDYVEMGVMGWQDTPEYKRLLEIVEPYEYLERYTMPKYLINASGDQFFLPDSWKFYYKNLLGQKHLRYVPNAGHSLDGSDAVYSSGRLLQRDIEQDETARVRLGSAGGRLDQSDDEDSPEGSVALAMHQHGDARLPHRYHRQNLDEQQTAPVEPWRLCGPRARTGERLDGVHGRVDLRRADQARHISQARRPAWPSDRQSGCAVQVHHRNQRPARDDAIRVQAHADPKPVALGQGSDPQMTQIFADSKTNLCTSAKSAD